MTTAEVPACHTPAAPAYPRDRNLPDLFQAQVSARPHAPAAWHRGEELTYAQLDARSDHVAARLLDHGVEPGSAVGVCGGRSLEALVAVLGVLKAGCAYVPLDEELPPARLRVMVEDGDVHAVVTLPGARRPRGPRTFVEVDPVSADLSGHVPVQARRAVSRPATNCAYVMFTSGSSGRPKPVVITHRGVVRLVLSDPGLPPPGPGDRVLHGYSLSSDASTIEIWNGLLTGACLVLVDRADLVSPPALEDVLRDHGVTVAYLTTSVFHHVARTRPRALSGLRFVSAGGEAMDSSLAATVMAACPDTTVVNFYGPTENTVVSTVHVLRAAPAQDMGVPIGRPFGASTAHVLRADGSVAAPGEEGELYVGGDGLAVGYAGDAELTAERFVTVDVHGRPERLYRTGDRAVRAHDGVLEYRGRLDRQVKLRGHRIELDEIEARLRAHPAVGEAAVELDGDRPVAYLTAAEPGDPLPLEALRAYCAQWLPSQAVPLLVAMRQFPVGGSGKVDRKRLSVNAATAGTAAPVESVLDAIAHVWELVLRERPAPDDDFFAVGGDSLLASEIVTRTLAVLNIDAAFGSSLIRSLLDTPTLAGFAEAVRAVRGSAAAAPAAPVDFARERELGVTLPPAQRPGPRPENPSEVLLTGATGFVGAFLLRRLLQATSARVHLPVRATTSAHAERRVRAALGRYGLRLPDGAWRRVVCFPADLAAPGLGMSPDHTAKLAGCLDLVVHNAAQVNFLYPYQALRAANVESTREIIRLAGPRRVPVHFLSTIAVLAGFGTAGVRHVDEDAELDHADRLSMGYAESKWVAEGLLRQAAAQGLPTAVYRPYEITGDRRHGACNTDTAICSLFKTIAETGLAPDIDLPMDFVPVDYVAEAVVHVATRQRAGDRVYHLTNPRPALLGDVLERMRAAGCALRMLPYQQWVGELVRHVARHPTSPTAPFVSLCVDRGHKADISVKEMYLDGTFPRLGRRNLEQALDGSGLHCPPVDADLLDRYLEYFFTSGYIPRPRRPEPELEELV
ncbi:thioester reductase [Kibdelosporangium phytohabitans]|uniref:Thioester reductase n=1 Tax=Kibdelosporangium phytohabitans TaxID=860235 RepID=A0A0N9I5P1_9PSEU|nr:thioester reductase [Kibdelosporangium phytohabitans]